MAALFLVPHTRRRGYTVIMLCTPPLDPEVPIIETGRLRLRGMTLADFPAHCALWADPDVSRYTSGAPSTPEEAWARMLRHAGLWSLIGFGFWLVEERDSGAFVGEVGLFDNRRALIYPDGETRALTTPEIGWILSPAMHGRGYATEAVEACLAWARGRFHADEVSCIIEPANEASLRVAEKTGFVLRETLTYRDKPILLLVRELA